MSSTRLSLDEVKARESRSREDELLYFTVETTCLGCKKKVSAQVNQLHGKLICPRCSTVMHMRQDGKWYKGPPPTCIIEAPKFTRWQRLCYRFPILKKRSVQGGLGLVLTLILVGLLAVLFAGPTVNLPPDLRGRAKLVCEFVIQEEYRKFKQCVSAETSSEAAEWFEQLRASIAHSEAQDYRTTLGSVETIAESTDQRHAQVKTSFRFVPISGQPNQEEMVLEVILIWDFHPTKGWLLNGRKTLNLLSG